jgi:predicted SAM-dependent methyltransferase
MASRKIVINIKWMGEVEKIEKHVLKWITPQMNGVDIGSGGAPILLQAIAIDRNCPSQYSDYVHLKGDARKLNWFKDESLDYVFSSHCFEDFEPNEKEQVLREWLRVIKIGGLLLLYLPNEQDYRKYCKEHNATSNQDHKDEYFSIETVRELARKVGGTHEELAITKHGDYCFFIVLRKVGRTC